jgi:cytochrome c peroxidase
MTCVEAKRNATSVDGGPGEDPLFTDFTASNIGTPANPQLPYYAEGEPDARGCVANKSGASFIHLGVGGFLPNGHPLSLPQSIRGGDRWSCRIADAFRCPRCATSTSGRALTL